ncbi:MAG: phage holin family protein [Candidatus Dormibacteria bacterium]|jgi:protein-S-isoprenylcysteine O-methyltransferase Ste14
MARQETGSPPAPTASVIDALRGIVADGVRFVRAEIGLVRAQGTATAKRAAIAVALLAAAVVALLLVGVFLLGAGAEGLGGLLHHPWLGWLIMGGLILIVGAVLGWLGYRMLRRSIAEGRRIGTTVKEDLEWVRELLKQNASGS